MARDRGRPLWRHGSASRLSGRRLSDRQQQQQIFVSRQIKPGNVLTSATPEHEPIQLIDGIGRTPQRFDALQLRAIVFQRPSASLKGRKRRALGMEPVFEARAQLIERRDTPQRVIEPQQLKIRQRGRDVMSDMPAQAIDRLFVLSDRDKEFRLLQHVEQIFRMFDVLHSRDRGRGTLNHRRPPRLGHGHGLILRAHLPGCRCMGRGDLPNRHCRGLIGLLGLWPDGRPNRRAERVRLQRLTVERHAPMPRLAPLPTLLPYQREQPRQCKGKRTSQPVHHQR